jgi:type I restriction enzyme M protein
VKTGLLFFERPGPTKETLYYELPIPEGLKKFSKGSPIADEHFAEARQIWQCWDAYRCGKGPQPEPTANSWIEAAETLAVRGYDLSAKNPNRPESEKLPHPAELTATLLERNRELHAILENLHAMLSNGNEEASEAS